MNKQLINLTGVLLSVLVLIVGVFAFALPLFVQAEATSRDAAGVRQTNATQQVAIDALRAQQEKSDELDKEIAGLRAQIPVIPHTDDVIFLAISAARSVGGSVTAVNATTVEPFAPRTGPVADGGNAGLLQSQLPAQGGSAAPAESTPPEGTPAVDGDATPDETQPAAEASAAPSNASSGKMQIPMTIEMTVPSVEAATAAIDALRSGPRLVAITSATTTSTDQGVTLSVSVLAFLDSTGK